MILSANDISKFHNQKCILDHVSFTIEEHDKIALIGVNGTGKTTFLQIAADQCDHEGKSIMRQGDCRISSLAQTPQLKPDNSVLKQVEESLLPNHAKAFEIKAILNRLGIDEYEQKIETLSGGQQKRVALAIALLQPCDLLILDEPTNHLDNEMIEWLEKYLIQFNGSILMVTHDRYFLDAVATKIWEIDQGKLYQYTGNYSYYLDQKANREKQLMAQDKKRSSFLKKELEWVRAGVQARGTKSKGRLDRFQELHNMQRVKLQDHVAMISLHTRLGKKTIELKQLGMAYGERILFHDFNYHFKPDDRIGILGANGCGKSTLLKIIAKQLQASYGSVIYGETVKIGYFKQGNEDIDESMRVIDSIREISDDLQTNEGNFSAKAMLERFLFDAQLQHSKIASLSGGEKRRLYLLRVLMGAPNVLLLDEPTNDLDITTLRILEEYLDQFNGIVVIVSHDRYFLDRICESLFVFKSGTIQIHIGGYSTYMNLAEDEMKAKKNGAERYALLKQEQKHLSMSSKEKQELEGMEQLIIALKKQLDDLDRQMNECQNDFDRIEMFTKERDGLSELLEMKSERWMELLDKEEQIQRYKKK